MNSRLTGPAERGGALLELERSPPRRGQVVVISDFLDDHDWATPLRRLALHHQVVAAQIVDPRELALPAIGIAAFVDPETGRRLHVQTNSAALRNRYRVRPRGRQESIAASDARFRRRAPRARDRSRLAARHRQVRGRRRALRAGGRPVPPGRHGRRPNLTAVAAAPTKNRRNPVSFAVPSRLLLIVVPLVLLGRVHPRCSDRAASTRVRFTSVELLASVAPRRPGWQRHISAALMLVALVALVVGLARPNRATNASPAIAAR